MSTNKPATFHAKHLRSVFAPVEMCSFGPAEQDACAGFLQQRAAATTIEPISAPEQLTMRADGAVAETGYRFSPIGFTAVAGALSQGLSSVFNELAGEVRYKHAVGAAPANVGAATAIFNIALAANFEQLRERNLLINTATKTIEGFLGLDHKFLDNSAFVDMIAREMFEAHSVDAKFYRAEIVGRELRVYYADDKNKWSYSYRDSGHIFGGGWYFSNREDTGTSVYATTCLLTKFGLGLMPDYGKNHVRHAGADIVGRAAMLVTRVANTSFLGRDVLEPALRKLSRMPLISNEAQSLDAAVGHWANVLTRYKIARDDAKKICKNALLVGADMSPQDALAAYSRPVLTSRTAYDLLCAMLRHARGQYHTTRDAVQRAAMTIVLENLKRKEK
jgi:hypothetical protein